MHLQMLLSKDLQCIQAIHVLYVCSLGIEPTTFWANNAMLYHEPQEQYFSVSNSLF